MAANSKIEWTTHTFNPWRGCSKVHTGCANCYAEATSKRNETILGTWGPNGTRVVAAERSWSNVLKWNAAAAKAGRRDRVFCASLADVFEDWSGPVLDHFGGNHYTKDGDPSGVVNSEQMHGLDSVGYHYTTLDDVRRRLFALIDSTPSLDWLLLTKRPENIRRFAYDAWTEKVSGHVSQNEGDGRRWKPRGNVWLGTSIAVQADADANIPALLACRDLSPVLFVSAEPLLGPVDLGEIRDADCYPGCAFFDVLRGRMIHEDDGYQWTPATAVDWLIVGGESGPSARPCNVEWIRAIVEQCKGAGVACFVKQLGANVVANVACFVKRLGANVVANSESASLGGVYSCARSDEPKLNLMIDDHKGGNPDEWPVDLRVRELPEANR